MVEPYSTGSYQRPKTITHTSKKKATPFFKINCFHNHAMSLVNSKHNPALLFKTHKPYGVTGTLIGQCLVNLLLVSPPKAIWKIGYWKSDPPLCLLHPLMYFSVFILQWSMLK